MSDSFMNASEEMLRSEVMTVLSENESAVKTIFNLPENMDVVMRKFRVLGREAFLAYVEGLCNSHAVSEYVLGPCILKGEEGFNTGSALTYIRENVIYAAQSKEENLFSDIAREMLSGMCAMFVEGCADALVIDIRKVPHRMVNHTNNESVVLGPQEGFVENLRCNISLIRKNLPSPRLITEMLEIGSENKLKCAVLYMKGVADEDAVQEAKRRLKSITNKTVSGTGQIQQLIEDHPMALFPQILQTERPDRTAQGLSEGQFAILCENSPYALLAPATFFHFVHASDDTFMRWQYGTFVRLIRTFGMLLSLLLPGMYIALSSFHTHLLPMNLLTSIAEARANVPFPIFGEILFMEFSFNLINEAGTRIPSQIGSALGIVGALILGQAAVTASIISPILIIIVAITGLGNFVIPSYSLSIAMEIYRLLILIAGAVFGLYGVVLISLLMITDVCSMHSFSAPYMAPFAPYRPHNPDLILRLPLWMQKIPMFFSGGKRR